MARVKIADPHRRREVLERDRRSDRPWQIFVGAAALLGVAALFAVERPQSGQEREGAHPTAGYSAPAGADGALPNTSPIPSASADVFERSRAIASRYDSCYINDIYVTQDAQKQRIVKFDLRAAVSAPGLEYRQADGADDEIKWTEPTALARVSSGGDADPSSVQTETTRFVRGSSEEEIHGHLVLDPATKDRNISILVYTAAQAPNSPQDYQSTGCGILAPTDDGGYYIADGRPGTEVGQQ